MLCASGELVYLHEPFNPGIWPRWMASPLPARDLYVCHDNEAAFLDQVTDVVRRRIPVRAQIGEVRSLRDAARLTRNALRNGVLARRRAPTLMKDPIAVFSAAWLAERFDADVVMMIRNPIAYASSIKRLGWKFDFDNWLRQDLLVRDHLGPHLAAIERARTTAPGPIDQAILRWNVIYAFVARMREIHPTWHFVLHEELSRAPEEGFAELYGALGLHFDAAARRAVRAHSAASNAKDAPPGDKGGIRRDSKAAVETWRHRLTDEEIDAVRRGTAKVAELFYESTEPAS